MVGDLPPDASDSDSSDDGPRPADESKLGEDGKAAEFEPDEEVGTTAETYTPFGASLYGAEARAALAFADPTGLTEDPAGAGAGGTPLSAQKSNTTSTLFVSSTLSEPDVEEMLASVSMLLQHQMQEELDRFDPSAPIPAYDFSEDETAAEMGDPDVVPSMDEIYSFLKKTFKVAKWSPECHIMALVYVNRLTGYTNIRLHNANWRPILLCSLLLAQKLWDDKSLANVDFPYIWRKAMPSRHHSKISLKRVNHMERKFLELLQYNVNVKSSLYAKYYFELRTLRDGEESFPLQPLKPDQERRLQVRSEAFNEVLSSKEKDTALHRGHASSYA